jgi:hypothetical protein
MAPGWTNVLRFAPGQRVRFTRSRAPALRTALAQAAPAVQWLAAVEGAIVTLERLEPGRCALTVRSPAGSAGADARPAPDATFDVHATVTRDGKDTARTVSGIVLMLGGSTDAYVARRSAAGTQQLVRLRYDRGSTYAEVAVFTASFAERLKPAVRALMPSMLVVGRLDVVRDAGTA